KTNDMQTEGEVIERPEHHSTFQHLPIPHETQLHLQLSEAYLDIKDSLTFHVTREWEMGFGYNLMPVVLGLGIAVYFWAPAEPSLFALVLTPIIGMLVLRKLGQFGNWYYVFLGLVVFFCGMLAAKIAVLNSVTPVIEKRMIAEVSGIVLNVDQNRRGASRYLIRPQAVSGLNADEMPLRLRISASSKHDKLLPGDTIKGLANIQPVSGPVMPGSYDFAFFAWFNGLGGSGYFMGPPVMGKKLAEPNLSDWLHVLVNRFRSRIEQRIRSALPDETGHVAIALVTGNKSGITEPIRQALRNTGLAHILAISGLHMALVTLTVVALIRHAMANIPSVALVKPVKKIAVCFGFVSATGYLMISGWGVATQRAWIMISVMLLAVLLDRRAITMRSVATAATIILLIRPESLFSPGFQMSFAAVTSLVAGYELITKYRFERRDIHPYANQTCWIFRTFKFINLYFGGIAATSIIAGLATAIFVAWHFHQIAPLGLLANLLAMPIVSLIIMPGVLFSVLLMPYGLESLALAPVSIGIGWVIDIAQRIDAVSPTSITGVLHGNFIICIVLFLITLTVLKTKLRLLAFVPL
ncbi:MAG: ComEC/Rec2 family competence protein, partial [Pseudomonadota bacterium]